MLIDEKTGEEYVQPPPYAIQLEAVEGCTLRCSFCGLNGIRTNERLAKFMTKSTIERITSELARLGWTSRLEFAMHGEPSLHPQLHKMVKMLRDALPDNRIMVTTNGTPLAKGGKFKENVDKLFDAGLTVLALDEYEGIKVAEDHARHYRKKGVLRYEYPDQPEGNPHSVRAPGEQVLTIIRNIAEETKGTHATLNNHAGAGAPRNEDGHGKRCAKPFRELSIRWDGSVAICCNDWRGEYKIANVNDMGLDELWEHDRFDAARKALYHGQRIMSPCHGCDARSYRVGLLPDRKGKVELAEPSDADFDLMEEALAGDPFTPPVFREWEKEKLLPVVVQRS